MLEPTEWFGPDKAQTKSAQPVLFLTMPDERQKGWIDYEDKVICLLIIKGKIRFRTGHICSLPGSHGSGLEIDNVSKTVVWCDQEIRDCDDFDDRHEKSFLVSDPCLMKLDEIIFLRDGKVALQWFKKVFTPCQILRIVKLLASDDLGIFAEQQEEAAAWHDTINKINARLAWWKEKGQSHQPFGQTAPAA